MKLRKPLPPFIGSSVDPMQLSLTIKGVIVAILPVLIWALSQAGVQLAQSDVLQVIEQLSGIVAAAITLTGLVRKLYVFVKSLISK